MEFNKNDAINVQIKEYFRKNGNKYKIITYSYKCTNLDCDNLIKIQGNKGHSCKCKHYTQKKRPYEYILSELY